MTVDEVKALLRIEPTNTKNDAYLTAVLPLVEDYVKGYCNNQFLNDLGETVYPGSVQLAIAQLCRWHMRAGQVQVENMRNNSSLSLEQYPSDLLRSLRQHKRPIFVPTPTGDDNDI
jgi:hypothetical protein